MCTSLPLAKEEVADDLEARRRVQPGGVQHEPLPLSRRGHGAAARVSGRGQGVDEGARTRRCSWQAGQRGARGCPGRRDAARSMRRGARAREGRRAPRGAGRSCRRSAAWRSEREGSVRAQRRRARGGRGRAARVEVGVETARAQRTGDGGVELPGTTAPAPASRGCRCTQSPRRRCRPERVTSPRAGEERARRGRGVASPCRTSRTSCHERRPSSRRRLTLRLDLDRKDMCFQRQRFSWGGAAVGNGIFEAERRCIHSCCVRIWAHQRLLIGNLCKFDHCAVGLVVEGGGVQDLRRRFAMGRRQTGDRLARSERRKVMFPSLPAGGFTCADGQAVRGGARASAGLASAQRAGWIIDSDRACASTEWHIEAVSPSFCLKQSRSDWIGWSSTLLRGRRGARSEELLSGGRAGEAARGARCARVDEQV